MQSHQWVSMSVEQTKAIAAMMANHIATLYDDKGFFITLEGNLGAGKTAFSQGFIQSLCPDVRVKSPTFSFIESYQSANFGLHHLDLYRLQDAEELEYLGLRDLFWHSICLIEWASRGDGWLPTPDWAVHIVSIEGDRRQITLNAISESGKLCLASMLKA
jgi:tRNA threonylcarbamoyladenosine biosynthesis protein TsaE